MKQRSLYFLIIFLLISFQPLQAQQNSQSVKYFTNASQVSYEQEEYENPLFTDEGLLKFKLIMDVKEVLKDRGEDREYHDAVITYHDQTGAVVTETLRVKVRGNRRRDPTVCNFPPLLLNFKRSTVVNTIFGKVNKIKMVTHCIGEEYVLREYLVYKLYNIVSDRSFRVRLCLITYEDIQGKKKPEERYAFLIEDDGDMAERNGGTIVPDDLLIRMDRTEPLSMAKLAVFQYMIGNTDWSVPYRHNIEVLAVDSEFLAVPFDFDYCGMVDAPYAAPPPELGIDNVRQRLFRGYSFTEETYSEVTNFFNRNREDFYEVYTGSKVLDKRSKKKAVKYLDSFYEVLNDSKDFQREIVRVGKSNEKTVISIKGLE